MPRIPAKGQAAKERRKWQKNGNKWNGTKWACVRSGEKANNVITLLPENIDMDTHFPTVLKLLDPFLVNRGREVHEPTGHELAYIVIVTDSMSFYHIFMWSKYVVIAECQVWTIQIMFKKLPVSLLQFLFWVKASVSDRVLSQTRRMLLIAWYVFVQKNFKIVFNGTEKW